MANYTYRKWRYLTARKLVKLFSQPENNDWTPAMVYERIGIYFTAVNDETFTKLIKEEPVFDEELPLFYEALLEYAKEFRQVAWLLETGMKRPSDYPASEFPQYAKLVEIYLRRQSERLAKEHEAEKK
ncbi:hypothetical protein [Alistipes sp.]|uniref:hypothetical protein n=1 Tax=Alistipes sp. TaxID=1872444 RepID=UPI003AEF275D